MAKVIRGNVDATQLKGASRQGDANVAQMFGGGTTTTGDLATYDAGGNVIDGGLVAAGGGAFGKGAWFQEQPKGARNGTNKVFTLTYTPVPGFVILELNGAVQDPYNQFSLSGNTITYVDAPSSVSRHVIWYFRGDAAGGGGGGGTSAVFTAPTAVQASGGRAATSVAFAKNVTSGNLLIACLACETGSALGLSDSLGTSYTLAGQSTSGGIITTVWVGVAPSSGANTITFSGSGITIPNCGCAEFANVTATVDAVATGGFSSSPSTVTTSSITTTAGQDLLFCYISGFRNAGRFTAGTGNIQLFETTSQDSSGAESRVGGAAGSYTTAFGNTGNDQGGYVFLALKPNTAISITTPVVPDAAIGSAYTYTLQAAGGAGAYTWSLSAGILPAGLSLSSGGVISGTPTGGLGANALVFQVTDASSSTATLPITVKVGSGLAAITHVQGRSSAASSLAFTSNVTAGNLLVVAAFNGSSASLFPVSDSLGTVYQLMGLRSINSAGSTVSQFVAVWAGIAPTSGANTVSTASSASDLIISEFSGVQCFNDNTNLTTGNSGSGSVTITSSTLTTLVDNELLYSAATGFSGATTLGINSPYTQEAAIGGSSGSQDASGYEAAGAAGTYTASLAENNNAVGDWAIILAGFRPAVVP